MKDDSYLQAQQQQEEQEYELQEYELQEDEHQQYLEVLAKGDDYGNN
jgi:hypothetical protein